MIKLKPVPYSSRAVPTVPADSPDFQWKSHSDVQSTWMRLTDWRPIYTNQPPKYVEPKESFVTVLAERRRAK
jgi:hypothetical protein